MQNTAFMKGHLRASGQTVLKSPETPELVKMRGKWAWRGCAPLESHGLGLFVCHSLVGRAESATCHLHLQVSFLLTNCRRRAELRGKVGCVPVASFFLLLTHESVCACVCAHTCPHSTVTSVRVKSVICTEVVGVSSLSCFSVQRRLLWASGRLLGQVSSPD